MNKIKYNIPYTPKIVAKNVLDVVKNKKFADGLIRNKENLRLIRDNIVIHEGKLSSLKRFQEEVKEVQVNQECGISFQNYQDLKDGDVIECYEIETIERTL